MKDFHEFYEAAHKRGPFKWQADLASEVGARGCWPDTVSLPTASGKTSIVDIWAWLQTKDAAPRRLFYVIDRRIVVDSAAEHARQIPGIEIVTLRGGSYRDESWIRDPTRPAAVFTTVDQIGSRLLFRGYGVSPGTRSIHAGLVANDALIVVDEAHLSQPFLETVRRVALRHSIQMVEMTATPRSAGGWNFSPSLSDKLLVKRHSVQKATRLAETQRFEATCIREATKLSKNSSVVGVVVNRVNSARAIFAALKESGDTVLLTGRVRSYDREQVLDRYLDRMRAGRRRTDNGSTLYVVATQTIEVGADLDFDALVTEAAPIDTLEQRFGRLNRLGDRPGAHAVIVKREGEKDRLYGDTLERTWKKLASWAKKTETVDMGVNALKARKPPDNCRTEPAAGEVLTAAHLRKLVQTRRPAESDVDVADFLHGREIDRDVQIVWRTDLGPDPTRWLDIVALAPPNARESLPTPIWEATSWLDRRPALVWTGPESEVRTSFRVGDVLVVPASYGGCDEFGWNPKSTDSVTDIGDLTSDPPRRRVHLVDAAKPLIAELYEVDDEVTREQIEALIGETLDGQWVVPAPDLCVVTLPQSGSSADDSASFGRHAVELEVHLRDVAATVRRMAEDCGLDAALIQDLEVAARLHDLGKRDPRFQLMLAAPAGMVLAKSASPTPLADYLRTCSQLGVDHQLPRHEVLSLSAPEAATAIEGANDPELVRHLVGTHHGYGRGFFPPHTEEIDEYEWLEQFARLRQRYGDWRLAYFEALLRLADWEASANPSAVVADRRTAA